MTTPNFTGTSFERKCCALLVKHRAYVKTNLKVYWSPTNWYEPDAVTEKELFEFKYQQVNGSVKNKLTQAIFEAQYMGEALELRSALVYEGEVLEHFVHNDPAFLKAHSLCPNVQLLSYLDFHDYITSGSDINNWNKNRLLEHTTACC